MRHVEVVSQVGRSAETVWQRAVTQDGINDELRPILKMTMPAGLRGRTIADVEVGAPVGRSWILLGGVLPVDYDDIVLAEVEPGRRFLERSRTLLFSVWQHERTIETEGSGCRVTDRLSFELKSLARAIPGAASIAQAIVESLFRHRHRRLARG